MLNGVSKRLPTGVDLLKVYPDKVDLFIQDIDRNGQGQLDDEFQINIEGIPQKSPKKSGQFFFSIFLFY